MEKQPLGTPPFGISAQLTWRRALVMSGVFRLNNPCLYMLIHAGNKTVPAQLMIRAPSARNKTTTLIHDTGIVAVRAPIAQGDAREIVDGLQVFKLPHALIGSTQKFYKN